MGQPQPQQQPVTNEVLAYQLSQIQETVRQVLAELKGAASKEDLIALSLRVRVLEDDRTRAYTILSLGGLLGLGGIGALIKYFST